MKRLRILFVLVVGWCMSPGIALAAGDGHEVNPNPLTIDPDLAIVTAIIFLVLLVVLGKFAWGPIADGLRRREDSIADQIEQAKQAAAKAEQQMAQYEKKLIGAATEVRDMLEQARRDAESHRQRIIAEAQEAAKAERDRAVAEIGAAKNQALGELAQRSVDTAVDLAGKIVRRQLNAEDHARLIQESLDRFPSSN